MAVKNDLLESVKEEMPFTRKMLERVPGDKLMWKPHEKSMTLGRLASHIAEMAEWVIRILSFDEFDFKTNELKRPTFENTAMIMEVFESRQAEAIRLLEQATDEKLGDHFIIRKGDHVIFNRPRKSLIRHLAINHLVHHRGQLSVYLRLLDVSVPGMYGPSADER